MQAWIKFVHLDQYPQCLHPWGIHENTKLRKSNGKHMLRAVLDLTLGTKEKSINTTNRSIGSHIHEPSQASAAMSHQNISPPKQVIKPLTKRLLDRALHKKEEFLTLVDRSPCTYVDGLYVRFMETVTCLMPRGDDDEICQELMKIGELIKDIMTIEDRILNAAGVGNDLVEAQQIREEMQEVERWLEDILCGTLEGVDILTKAYEDGTLLFQHVAK
ncbi:hypothetical protein EDD18DRAFT_1360515 [Armillaria luteobubalina]|uniref:Uncharacterized protein n=1 Tax=Armillaria luteobubalina TaxID=153913 RepID=A0AA39UKJ5_9AGAR|nr:hypothetical protein EDD18DRAFT_1360515 [Armillaria luteobubalina]